MKMERAARYPMIPPVRYVCGRFPPPDDKMKTKILPVMLGIFLVSGMAFAYTDIYGCWCKCPKGPVRLETSSGTQGVISNANSGDECVKSCGGICGSYAEYPDDCGDCSIYCSTMPDPDSKSRCITSCESKCGLNKTIYDLINMVYYLAGIIAVIMFVVHGYKLMTSTTAGDRDDAKKGIMLVIAALFIIAIAGVFVKLLIGTSAAHSEIIKEVLPGVCEPGSNIFPTSMSSGNCDFIYGLMSLGKTGVRVKHDGEICFLKYSKIRKTYVNFDHITDKDAYYLFWGEDGKGCKVSHVTGGEICVWEISKS
jgi:hypothetical protein